MKSKCEHCGFETWVTYRDYCDMFLCDRCTDKALYGDEYWEEESAKRMGYPPCPKPYPKLVK